MPCFYVVGEERSGILKFGRGAAVLIRLKQWRGICK
jgi:hypothetical protein